MTKRRGKSTHISSLLFEEVNPYGAVVGEPAAAAARYPLDQIVPDFHQPRQLLPAALAQALHQGQMTPAEVMQRWLQPAAPAGDSGRAQEVQALRQLATAIERYGLINPITIRPAGVDEPRPPAAQYVVVTGERRYWAHVLLALEGREISEGETLQSPAEIRASLMPDGTLVRAHQIVENLMREDINVIEKANGLWALLYELSYDAYRRQAATAESDAYRRQSTNAFPEEMPLLPWRRVEEALGISRQYRARIIAVLELSDEAQALIDRHNLAEATIRPVVEKLRPYPDLQVQALQQLIAWQAAEEADDGPGRQIVPSMRALVARMLGQVTHPAGAEPTPTGQQTASQLRQKVRGTVRFMSRLSPADLDGLAQSIAQDTQRAEILADLEALRRQIDQVLLSIKRR